MPVITAFLGDITEQDVDAVVSAANNAVRGGGGVAGAIHRSGGPAILRDCVARFPNGLATGDAGWTAAGDLPARWVIHAVGPNFTAGQRDRSLLESCYRRALEVADGLNVRSVAFPLLCTGAYGWPRADAITAAIEAITATRTRVEEVRLVTLDESVYKQTRAEILVRYPPPVGEGTVGFLFERTPTQFCLRGDDYLWRELRAHFADTPLPRDWFGFRALVTAAIEHIIGEPLSDRQYAPWLDNHSAAIRVPEFDPGHGMSAGGVHVPWWVHTAVPILIDRFEATHESEKRLRD
ncbi:hypothetical protein GCM10009682_18010 [Luedemannella flava]|uniref:Macro domain-containing protein n=1 Tax=Luedemannella flava TaxID=349316 RepID=A0ABN2LQE0_9ACTN